MKYYKTSDDIVFAYESDGSQDHIIPDDQTTITKAQADELRRPSTTTSDIWEHIKAERERRKVNGVKVNGKWFHTDNDSRIQQLGLKDRARDLLAAGGVMTDNIFILGQQVNWKTMDGSFVPITVQATFDIVSAVGDLDAIQHATAEAHKAAMEASADPASYDYSTGWQEIYSETL